jgi:hypothetical protein
MDVVVAVAVMLPLKVLDGVRTLKTHYTIPFAELFMGNILGAMTSPTPTHVVGLD